MKKEMNWFRLPLFIALSLCLGIFLEFWGRLPGMSIASHAYVWKPDRLLVAAFILFPLILGLWALSTGLLTVLFKEKYSRVSGLDFWTYLPVLFFGLTPFALVHYLDRQDLARRLNLLAVIVIGTVLGLKIIQGVRLSRARSRPAPTGIVQRFERQSRGKKLVLLFLAALVLYNAGALVMRSKGQYFSGDEPHYLLICRSLLHDRDFDLKNNYENRDYERYLQPGVTIDPHVIKRAEAGPWYSFHSPGVAFVLLPFYALGDLAGQNALIFLLRFGMSVFGALFGLQIYLFARREWGKEGLALGLWFLVGVTTPVFFYAIHVYPELIVGFLSLTLFRLIRHSESWPARKLVAAGFLFSAIIWFHALKYLFLLAPLFLYFLWVAGRKTARKPTLLYFFLGPALVGGLYLVFQYSCYGSISPSAISWKGALSGSESVSYFKYLLVGIPFHYRLETLAGYFLDQKDGLLFYAPLYFFSFLGMVEALRRKKSAFWAVAFVTAPYVLASAFLTQRTGYAPQARPLVSVIWGMAILLGAFMAHNGKKLFSTLLAAASVLSMIVVVLLLLNPTALYQETTQGSLERGGGLFLLSSNLHHSLREALPSFIKVEGAATWWPNIIWPGLIVLFVLAYVLWRKHEFRPPFSVQAAIALALCGLLCFWFVYYPRDMLLNPVRVDMPQGGRLDFYSLSLRARMTGPARFNLVEDNRTYYFSFVTVRPLRQLLTNFGSTKGDYAVALELFDQTFFKDRTRRELRTHVYVGPPAYRLGQKYLYRLAVVLKKKSTVSTAENPYLFALRPSW